MAGVGGGALSLPCYARNWNLYIILSLLTEVVLRIIEATIREGMGLRESV